MGIVQQTDENSWKTNKCFHSSKAFSHSVLWKSKRASLKSRNPRVYFKEMLTVVWQFVSNGKVVKKHPGFRFQFLVQTDLVQTTVYCPFVSLVKLFDAICHVKSTWLRQVKDTYWEVLGLHGTRFKWHYDEQVYGGKMREKERWNGVGAVVRGSSEDAREVNNQLILVACLPQGNKVISRPGLWPRAMSGSMFL